MKEFKHELGSEVKDKVTGFSGIVVVRSQFFTGCNRYSVQSKKLGKDNKPGEYIAFDEDQLEKVGKGVTMQIKDPGGNPDFKAQHHEVIKR